MLILNDNLGGKKLRKSALYFKRQSWSIEIDKKWATRLYVDQTASCAFNATNMLYALYFDIESWSIEIEEMTRSNCLICGCNATKPLFFRLFFTARCIALKWKVIQNLMNKVTHLSQKINGKPGLFCFGVSGESDSKRFSE